jgi:serine/threonine-protein kinase
MAGREFVVAAVRLLDGRYLIERLLGSGGMATVWRGRDLRLDRPVAIKEVSGEGLRQPMALQRFEREARAVGRLAHPNIVSVYDVGAEKGVPYLVMELVEGPTVATLLADGPLPIVDALAVASQVCDGLAAAHAAGVVHRDIKPANLILTATGVVKICDFGVARLLDSTGQANLTGPATAMGSPRYMAPEQINAGPVDPRTDLYALGCTLYAMLTGDPPFTAGGPFGIVQQHITKPPEALRGRRPEVSPEVEALVADLLAKRPDERPSDTAAVRARIAAATADPAIAAAPSSLRLSTVAPHTGAATATATPRTLPTGGDRPSNPDAGTRTPTTKERLWKTAALVAAALVVVTVVMAVLATLRTAPGGVAEQWTVPSAVTTASPSPGTVSSPTVAASPGAARRVVAPSTSAAATQTPSPPTDPILALRQAIQQQVDAGSLKADAANDLNHMVDDLVKSIATANTDDETHKLKALRDKLTALKNEAKLSADGYLVLSGYVDQVAATLS